MPERIHALDALRALALLAGITFHAALPYAPGSEWLVPDRSQSMWLWLPLYLCSRRGPRGFVRDRLKRILVPLAAGWCLLFPFIAWVWIAAAQRTRSPRLPPEAFPTGRIFQDGVSLRTSGSSSACWHSTRSPCCPCACRFAGCSPRALAGS